MATKKIDRACTPSGSAASKKCTLEFKLYEMMGFLDDLCKPLRTVTSLTSESESLSEAEAEAKTKEVIKAKSKSKINEKLLASLNSRSKKPKLDHIHCFLMSLGPPSKNLTEIKRLAVLREFIRIIRKEINDLLNSKKRTQS